MDDVAIDVAQQEYSNNKCYALAFRDIYIYIYIYIVIMPKIFSKSHSPYVLETILVKQKTKRTL